MYLKRNNQFRTPLRTNDGPPSLIGYPSHVKIYLLCLALKIEPVTSPLCSALLILNNASRVKSQYSKYTYTHLAEEPSLMAWA